MGHVEQALRSRYLDHSYARLVDGFLEVCPLHRCSVSVNQLSNVIKTNIIKTNARGPTTVASPFDALDPTNRAFPSSPSTASIHGSADAKSAPKAPPGGRVISMHAWLGQLHVAGDYRAVQTLRRGGDADSVPRSMRSMGEVRVRVCPTVLRMELIPGCLYV